MKKSERLEKDKALTLAKMQLIESVYTVMADLLIEKEKKFEEEVEKLEQEKKEAIKNLTVSEYLKGCFEDKCSCDYSLIFGKENNYQPTKKILKQCFYCRDKEFEEILAECVKDDKKTEVHRDGGVSLNDFKLRSNWKLEFIRKINEALNYKLNVYSVIPKNIKTEYNERFKVEKIEFKPVPKHYIKEIYGDENKLEIKVAKYNGETIIYLFNNVDSYDKKYNKLLASFCKQPL
jgi:hypothetical protein